MPREYTRRPWRKRWQRPRCARRTGEGYAGEIYLKPIAGPQDQAQAFLPGDAALRRAAGLEDLPLRRGVDAGGLPAEPELLEPGPVPGGEVQHGIQVGGYRGIVGPPGDRRVEQPPPEAPETGHEEPVAVDLEGGDPVVGRHRQVLLHGDGKGRLANPFWAFVLRRWGA